MTTRLERWDADGFSARLWKRDPSLWPGAPPSEVVNRLGWLDLPERAADALDGIEAFRREAHRENLTHAVLLGMGGSSLAPEVFARTFGRRKGYPELIVLDSTHPAAVRGVLERIHLERSLFIVSSKSGTTIETLSFLKYFWRRVEEAGLDPGRRFAAITDPGTPLEPLARERRFRHVFPGPRDVGGRYSALSVFGLVPAALIGVNVRAVMDGAWAMMEHVSASRPASRNPAVSLGAALGELALAGRDKVTFVTSPSLAALPAWIEQLVAESTGKNGRGVVPVVDETLGPPDVYDDDRVFIDIALRGDSLGAPHSTGLLQLRGHPIATIDIEDPTLLGQEFLRWEIAVAAAGSVLGVNPFDQPDVQLSKDLAKRAMAERRGDRARSSFDEGVETITADRAGEAGARLGEWLGAAGPGAYVGLHAYLSPSPPASAALQELRMAIAERTRRATTVGYGPRFLHSTGQLHKGGTGNGHFVQIVDDALETLPVPEEDYTFDELIRAQAAGDARALAERGRRVLRISLGAGGARALNEMAAALRI